MLSVAMKRVRELETLLKGFEIDRTLLKERNAQLEGLLKGIEAERKDLKERYEDLKRRYNTFTRDLSSWTAKAKSKLCCLCQNPRTVLDFPRMAEASSATVKRKIEMLGSTITPFKIQDGMENLVDPDGSQVDHTLDDVSDVTDLSKALLSD